MQLLLDNLRLDIADPTVVNNTTATNTNASALSLGYLKNGGGTESDQYAITGIKEWTNRREYAMHVLGVYSADTSEPRTKASIALF